MKLRERLERRLLLWSERHDSRLADFVNDLMSKPHIDEFGNEVWY